MKTIRFLCLLASLLSISEGKDDWSYEATINKILSPGFNCFKQREGVTCPPESRCCKRSRTRSVNGTKSCVKTSKPYVHFYLFTPKNKDNPEYLHECGGRLPSNTYFDPERCTTIFIHGLFDGVCRTAVWREMKDQMFVHQNCNIILVDWSRLNFPDIADALAENKNVGLKVCCLISNIIKQTGTTLRKFHLVGHSMGAHISGFAGQCILQKLGQLLWRITGLDPSNFGYCGYPPNQRLSFDDATWVDNIHSNIGECFPFKIGCKDALGHADFYPNGGSVQLSCYPDIIKSFIKLDIFYATVSLIPSFCSHVQSMQYYKVSINPCKCEFVGIECESYEKFKSGECRTCNGTNCAIMGMDWRSPSNDSSVVGKKYYLDTTLTCPYCDNSKIDLNGFLDKSEKEGSGQRCFESKTDGGIKPTLPTLWSMP